MTTYKHELQPGESLVLHSLDRGGLKLTLMSGNEFVDQLEADTFDIVIKAPEVPDVRTSRPTVIEVDFTSSKKRGRK